MEPNCDRCSGRTEPVTIMGYRMQIDSGRVRSGEPIETRVCTSCGNLSWWVPSVRTNG